jgi:type IV pilus assembly protein PilA
MKQQKYYRNISKYGFTLMELLIVIAILGILVAVGVVSFGASQRKSRDIDRKNDLRQVSLALESYYNDFGHYPLSTTDGNIIGCEIDALEDCVWGEPWRNTSTVPETIYMLTLPSDPAGRVYYYVSDINGSYYKLYAHLENDQDEGAGVNQAGYEDTDCGGGELCTYGIASTNIPLEE